MTKDELIARLRSLGEQLNRDVSLTGKPDWLMNLLTASMRSPSCVMSA